MSAYIRSKFAAITKLIRQRSFHAALIVLAGFAAYSNTFHVPFLFDDARNIATNPLVTDLHNFIDPSAYSSLKGRYVGYLSFALNYYLHGLNVTGYHIFNLTVHLINALLVYRLVMLTFRTPFFIQEGMSSSATTGLIAFFSAILFVAHPIQTQAVTYIVQRFASLATLFYLSSVVLYLQARLAAPEKRKFSAVRLVLFFFSLVASVLAMNTKEIAFTLPIMIGIYEFMFFRGNAWKRLLLLTPFLFTMLIIPLNLINFSMPAGDIIGDVGEVTRVQTEISRYDYLFTQFRVIVTYIRLLFLPINQNIDYDYPVYHSFFNQQVAASFLFLLAIFSVALHLLYRTHSSQQNPIAPVLRITSFGILWFFITLAVESSFIPILDVIFEHRLYLPSIGAFMAFSGVLWYFRIKYFNDNFVFNIVSAVLLIALVIVSYDRNIIWNNELTLWEDTANKSPNKSRPFNNLGYFYLKQADPYKAITFFEKAVVLNPNDINALYNMGKAYAQMRRFIQAEESYKKTVMLNPEFDIGWFDLGRTQELLGKYNDAIDSYAMVLIINPSDIRARKQQEMLLRRLGRHYP